jgi:biotin carboxylase
MPTKTSPLQGARILLVNTASKKKEYTLRRLKELGLEIVCLNKEKNWAVPYIDHWIFADTTKRDEAMLAVKAFINQYTDISLSGVLTFWEDDVMLVSQIVDAFGFCGIPFHISSITRNKYQFREFCRVHHLPAPQARFLQSSEDISFIRNNFQFPVVIKPAYGSHSAFVKKIESPSELKEAIVMIREKLTVEVESALVNGVGITVEEYLEGDEVDLDILVQNDHVHYCSITDNQKTNEPYFVETGESMPSLLPLDKQEGLKAMAAATIYALGIKDGCIHFEAKSTPKGPVPIEVNLRLGGGEVYLFNKEVWGVDLVEQCAKIAIGVPLTIIVPKAPLSALATEQFLPLRSGVVKSINVDPLMREQQYLVELEFEKKQREYIAAPPDGYDCLGWITAKGHNPQEALRHLKELKRFVCITMDYDT